MAAVTLKDRLLDLMVSPLLLDQAGLQAASEAVSPDAVTAVDFEVDSEAAIVEASVAEEDGEASDTRVEVALAEEVGMVVVDMVMAQHLPLTLLLAQAELEVVSAAAATVVPLLAVLQLSMALQAQTAVLLVGMALLVAHMTTDPLIVVGVAVEVGMVVMAVQEASLAATASPYDPEMEVIGTAIDTAAEDATTITEAESGITKAMATTTHAANGDISHLATLIGLLGGFSPFQHFFPLLRLGKGKQLHLRLIRLHHVVIGKAFNYELIIPVLPPRGFINSSMHFPTHDAGRKGYARHRHLAKLI